MTKRSVRRSILSFILTFVMVLSMMPATAMAAPGDDEGNGDTWEDYPWLGAYSAETASADNYLKDVTCENGEASFYIIEHFELEEGQEFSYGTWEWPEEDDEPGIFTPYENGDLPTVSDGEFNVEKQKFSDGTTVSVEKVSGTTAGSRIYKVTVSNMPLETERSLWFEAELKGTEDQEPGECVSLCVWAYNPLRTTGLFATTWLENGVPAEEAVPNAEEMWERIPEVSFYAVYKTKPEDEGVNATVDNLVLYLLDEDGEIGAEVKDAIRMLSYSDDDGNLQTSEECVTLHFTAEGTYLLCYKDGNSVDKEQGIIIHVTYPELGIYSEPEASAAALQSDTEFVCTKDPAEFYLIENIDEPDQPFSYGRYDEEENFVESDLPCVQDESISDNVEVTEVDTKTAGHRIYKVTVKNIPDDDSWWIEFNGQYKSASSDDVWKPSCGFGIRYMESGLVGGIYWDEDIPQEDYSPNLYCWEKEAQIAFGWIDDTGKFTTDQPWSGMTAEIYDFDGNKKVTGKFVEENIFAFDFAGLEFGDYHIVLKKGNEEYQMTLGLTMSWGWYIEKDNVDDYKVGDRLWDCVVWGQDEKHSSPLPGAASYISDKAPSLVLCGPAETTFLLQEGEDEDGNPTGKLISPSSSSKLWDSEDSDMLYTIETVGSSGTFVACYPDGGFEFIEIVPMLREHSMEEGYTGKKYYSGLFITKEEYEAGNWDYNGKMGIEAPTYWVYGEDLQEVLDKLKAKAAEDSSYSYEYINISTDLSDEDYSGRPDNQILDVGNKELKGIRLFSSSDRPWPTLTIKGCLDGSEEGDGRILMSGKWQDGAELNIGPKLHVFCEYALGMDADEGSAHCLTFPDDLLDGSWSGSRLGDETVAEKDGAKARILRNQSYGETTGTGFMIQCAMSEVEAEDILPPDNIEGDFIADNEKNNVEIGVASSEEGEEQNITDVIDFEENIVKAIVEDDKARLETKLTIEDKGDTAGNDEEKQAIQEKMQEAENLSSKVPGTAKKFRFIDITLKVVVVRDGEIKQDDQGNDVAQTVTETKSKLQISIPLPEELKWTPAATSKAKDIVYNVYRYHDGKAEKVNDTPLFLVDGKLTFKTDKFPTYAIEAVENEAQSIKVTTQPTKTAYTEGEIFSPEGMKVTVTYLDGTVEETTIYTVDKTSALTPADKQVIVTCMGLTTQVPITVSGKKEPTTETPTTETPTTAAPTTETPTTEAAAAVGEKVTVEGSSYVVTGATGTEKTVTFTEADKKATKVAVPASVDINGTAYQVTVIGDNAFAGSSKLTTVTMPSSITKIGKNAFKNCTKLKKVDIAKSVTEIDTNAFYNCKKLTTVKFKGTEIKKIGQGAFAKCQSLKSVTIPKSVTEIGKEAFKDCKKLSKITIKSTVLKKVGKNAFKNIAKKPVIKVPKKQKTAYKKLLKSAGYTKTVK